MLLAIESVGTEVLSTSYNSLYAYNTNIYIIDVYSIL